MQNLLNFHQLTDDIATAGQPAKDQFAAIQRAGYSTVINLAMSNSSNAVPEEEAIVTELGMRYVHIPVPFDKPDIQHLRIFIAVMTALSGQKVFVHCALNMRVSAFLYQYLVQVRGVAPEQARSPILIGWLPNMEAEWQAIMSASAEDLNL